MATAQLYLDTRREKIDGTFPLKIRIGNVKDAQLISTKISVSKSDFEKIKAGKGKLSAGLKDARLKVEALLKKANLILDSLDPFNSTVFNLRFHQKGNRLDLLFLLEEKAAQLIKQDKIGNSSLYSQTAALLKAYVISQKSKCEILLKSVDVPWLLRFEDWALAQLRKDSEGNFVQKYSKTTLGMYIIRIRSVFNNAISEQLIPANIYPFHRPQNNKGYKIPKGGANKRALSKGEITKLIDVVTMTDGESFARDIFIFSYLASGMNCVDIFRLKWSMIKDDQFSFVRKKTESKTGGKNLICIRLNSTLKAIIERHGRHKIGNEYIFNVIPTDANEVILLKSVRSAISTINTNLKKIARRLEITTDISTYFARHSFSTNLINNEVPVSFISKQLGHSSLKITETYLSEFTTEKATFYLDNLLEGSA